MLDSAIGDSSYPMIIAFTKDWDDVPTSTTHVLREMGKTIPVLWMESIGMRPPGLASGRDLARGFRRLAGLFRSAENRENFLWVRSPLLIPRAGSRAARVVNRKLLDRMLRRDLARVRRCTPQAPDRREYWCFLPNAVDLLPPDARTIVYYCVDDWSRFENLDGAWLARKEEEILQRADLVFAASRYLERKCRETAGDRTHYMPHGVDYPLFAGALDEATQVPSDIAGLPRPVAGFYGNISPWIDFRLVEDLARRLPGWSFVMIGPVYCDTGGLRALPNVHFPGRREHGMLPAYCKGFDVGIIPYDMNHARMQSVNPVKTKELLAAGVPVVASRIPELAGWGNPDVALCGSADEWRQALELQSKRKDRAAISRKMESEDWALKVSAMRAMIDRVVESQESGRQAASREQRG